MTQHTHSEFEEMGAKQEARVAADHARKQLRKELKRVNDGLYDLGYNKFHDGVPLDVVSTLLEANGFDALEPMMLCGREGRLNEPVGRGKYLTLTWYKMESGRYEVVAYVN